jgi:hypothetical protein
MTPAEILRLRLENQALARASFRKPEDAVAWFGAVQAQDYLGSLWAVGQRTQRATEASVEAAEARRAIIRTWPMRGTLHFVTPADARWMLSLLAPRVISRNAARLKREVDVDASVVARSRDIVERALEGGRRLERAAVYAALESRKIRTANSRGLHIVLWLAMEGTLCMAGRSGKQHTFALLDDWIPKSRYLARDEALAALAHRYFTSHGPATMRDFAWWAGITAKDAQAGVDGAQSSLAQDEVDGATYWWNEPPRSLRRNAAAANAEPQVRLLPAFDEYTVAYEDRSILCSDPQRRSKMELLNPAVLVDGRVVGTWKRVIDKRSVAIETSLWRSFNRAEHAALQEAASRFAGFLGAGVKLHSSRSRKPSA